jgi:hypothetical protein
MNHGLTTYKRKQLVFYLVLGSGLIAVYATFDPESLSFFPSCPFHSITGLYCPGCGSQRAIYDLLHANFLAALSHNPLIVLGIATGLYKAILWLKYPNSKAAPNNLFYYKNTPWIILILVIGFWVFRNIPLFNFLQP